MVFGMYRIPSEIFEYEYKAMVKEGVLDKIDH
jgi:hypothetical protein